MKNVCKIWPERDIGMTAARNLIRVNVPGTEACMDVFRIPKTWQMTSHRIGVIVACPEPVERTGGSSLDTHRTMMITCDFVQRQDLEEILTIGTHLNNRRNYRAIARDVPE
jgi:hypothetical protein